MLVRAGFSPGTFFCWSHWKLHTPTPHNLSIYFVKHTWKGTGRGPKKSRRWMETDPWINWQQSKLSAKICVPCTRTCLEMLLPLCAHKQNIKATSLYWLSYGLDSWRIMIWFVAVPWDSSLHWTIQSGPTANKHPIQSCEHTDFSKR